MSFNRFSQRLSNHLKEKVRNPHSGKNGTNDEKVEGLLMTSGVTLKRLSQASKLDCVFPVKVFPFNCVPLEFRCAVPYKNFAGNESTMRFSSFSGNLVRSRSWRLPKWSGYSVRLAETKAGGTGFTLRPPRDIANIGKPATEADEGFFQRVNASRLEQIKKKYMREIAEEAKKGRSASRQAVDPPKKG